MDSGHLIALHSFPVGSVALLSLPFLLSVAFLGAIRNVTTHELLLVHTLGGCQKHAKKARYWSRGVPRRFNRDEEEGKARADLKRGGGNKNSKRIG